MRRSFEEVEYFRKFLDALEAQEEDRPRPSGRPTA
jgi:hypothetical protein